MYLSSVPASKLGACGHICAVIQCEAVPGDQVPIPGAYLHIILSIICTLLIIYHSLRVIKSRSRVRKEVIEGDTGD